MFGITMACYGQLLAGHIIWTDRSTLQTTFCRFELPFFMPGFISHIHTDNWLRGQPWKKRLIDAVKQPHLSGHCLPIRPQLQLLAQADRQQPRCRWVQHVWNCYGSAGCGLAHGRLDVGPRPELSAALTTAVLVLLYCRTSVARTRAMLSIATRCPS